MEDSATILVVLAHPDDENGMGGTLARYASEGVRVVLVCATRGEAGTIFNPALATPETIAVVREQELRCSCAELGIEPPRFLDCSDGAVRECSDAALERVVALVRELRPQALITFGPDGIYGHPDHVAAHQLTTRAWQAAGNAAVFPQHRARGLLPWQPARLFYFALPTSLIKLWGQYGDLTVELNGKRLPITGVPDEQISLKLDVAPFLERKRRAWACHQTQMNPNAPLRQLPEELLERWQRWEHFVLAGGKPLPAGSADLLAGL